MIIAAVGDIVKTSGMRMAIVAVGPRPGRTPMSVPTRLPTSATRRLSGCSATANPLIRWSNMAAPSAHQPLEDADGQAHAQPLREPEVEDDRRGEGEPCHDGDASLAEEREQRAQRGEGGD